MYTEKKQTIKTYIIAILIPLAVGALAAFLTKDSMQIYQTLKAPPLAPPAWLFPVVWTALYILMGISSALVWQARKDDKRAVDTGLAYYAVSLAFNFAWSLIFFNQRWIAFAFFWLLALLYLVIRTLISYRKVVPLASYLQIPYVLWLAFAGYLNLGILLLN